MHWFLPTLVTFVAPTITGAEAMQLILRWFHFMAGITWVGLLYFFNLVNVSFMKQVDAAAKPKILQHMTLPALNWFRWSSVVTVFAGLWYWDTWSRRMRNGKALVRGARLGCSLGCGSESSSFSFS